MLAKCKQHAIRRIDDFRGRWYDLIHNVDTFGFISKNAVRIESNNKHMGRPYQRTPFRTIDTLFRHMIWGDGHFFIDVGCGKGLVLLAAARYPFERIVGIEYSSDLAAIAERNIVRYRGTLISKKNIVVVHTDATQFEFPSSPLICYFYYPFEPALLETVLDHLAASLEEHPREIRLVFHIRYPKNLVASRFEILEFSKIPYFHIYSLGPARKMQANGRPDTGIWELSETD